MLVLARGAGQCVVLDDRITVTVIGSKGGTVHLGIDAPADVGVRRGELEVLPDLVRPPRACTCGAHPSGDDRSPVAGPAG